MYIRRRRAISKASHWLTWKRALSEPLPMVDTRSRRTGGQCACPDAFVVRPTNVIGPFDCAGRLSWWIRHIREGGESLAFCANLTDRCTRSSRMARLSCRTTSSRHVSRGRFPYATKVRGHAGSNRLGNRTAAAETQLGSPRRNHSFVGARRILAHIGHGTRLLRQA